MRVLLTGAGGFVGRHLVRSLLAEGHETYAGSLSGEAPDPDLRGAAWLPLDLASPESLQTAVRESAPEWVFHLAGLSAVEHSDRSALQVWDVNATGTARLLACLPPGTRVIFASSAQVYGFVPETEQPITEDRPLRPSNAYAASKAAAEMAVLHHSLSGNLHGVVARSFNTVGPGQEPRFALPGFARQLAAVRAGLREPVLAVGNLDARRDFVDVRDAAAAYLRLAHAGTPGEVYNLCSGSAHTLRSLLDAMVQLCGADVRVEVDAARVRPLDVPLLVGDPSRLSALGWVPRFRMEETLSDLLRSAEAE